VVTELLGLALVIIGVLMLLATVLRGRVKASGGVLIMIGPIPILVASDQRIATMLYLLAILLVLLGIIATLVPLWYIQ